MTLEANGKCLLRVCRIKDTLKDGVYNGIWSGYTVVFQVGALTYQLQTDIGVRGLNIPCSITITDGEATVKAIECVNLKMHPGS